MTPTAHSTPGRTQLTTTIHLEGGTPHMTTTTTTGLRPGRARPTRGPARLGDIGAPEEQQPWELEPLTAEPAPAEAPAPAQPVTVPAEPEKVPV